MATAGLFPCPSKASLQDAFVGMHLNDVPTPAAVLDRAVLHRNCVQMLRACEEFGVKFRAHVKTHTEIAELQIGTSTSDARIIVSTLAEAESLMEFRDVWNGKPKTTMNILYGIPLPPSQAVRLGQLAKLCGPGGVSLLIDHPDQLHSIKTIHGVSGEQVRLFVKIDTGYHRAGIKPETPELETIVHRILSDCEPARFAKLWGFYSHAGHSYNENSESGAMALLQQEILGLEVAANAANKILREDDQPARGFVLSVGATPSASSIQNIGTQRTGTSRLTEQISELKAEVSRVNQTHEIELHAGVYTFLDLQQLATNASPSASGKELSTADIALTILSEVASLYPNRKNPEALLAAGSLSLGREPCKSYPGWGKVTSWNTTAAATENGSGWMLGRISQEHGILTQDEDTEFHVELYVGQKVRIWPNHACIAGAGFQFYLIVDSDLPESQRDTIVDVWVRCRGW